MRIYDYRNAEGRLTSFEIKNLGRSRACRFIESTLPSTIVRRQRSDDFGVFDFNGRTFVVTEPWGDNSRYLIHQEPTEPSAELDRLKSAFEAYQPSWAFSGSRPFMIVVAVFAALLACTIVAVALLSSP